MSDMIAEQATGISERVRDGGKLYDDAGNAISDTAARRIFRNGGTVAAPNAGAGSYRAILARLGFNKVEVEEWSSSAGDWCFRVRGGFVCQSNRYPYHGFIYGKAV